MKFVYLCVPYSHPDPEIRSSRAVLADKAAARIMEQGYVVFSPISHSHRIAHHLNNHNDGRFWLEQDMPFLNMADIVAVLKIPGWRESKGIQIELDIADKQGKEVMFIEDWEV